MIREAHLLTAGKTSSTPSRIIFFDSESHVEMEPTEEEIRILKENLQKKSSERERVYKPHKLYLICANYYTSRGTSEKHTYIDYTKENPTFVADFWNDVDEFSRWRQKTYMFAHNAKYDTLVMECIPQMVKRGYEVLGFSDSNPFILRLRKTRGTGKILPDGSEKMEHKTILILSSTNYYQQKLESLGKAFKLQKLEHDHSGVVPLHESIIYCRRDVEILTKAMLAFMKFVKDEGHGSFAMTVAGQAFSSFRTKFMDTSIYIHANQEATLVERRAYAGGRNEAWVLGEITDTVYGLDVNSMYPSVMVDGIFPTKLITFRRTMSLEGLKKNIEAGFLICCDALVSTKYPIFHLKEERLVFPTGKFWTTLSTPELIEGLERGLIKEVGNVCIYEGDKIFESFVEYFYNRRLEAKREKDSVHDLLYKIFLNSLYGKFGQKDITWERFDEADPDYIHEEHMLFPDIGLAHVKYFGGAGFRKMHDPANEEAFNSFCAVAAHVTSMARMMLFKYAEKAGLENVFYMDTDSLFVNKQGYNQLKVAGVIDDVKLGALALEKVGKLTVHGCKDYIFEEDETGKILTKMKGVPARATYLGDDEEGHPMYLQTAWMGYSKALHNKDLTTYENELIIKVLKREYNKGTPDENGKVEPFNYNVVGG